VVGPSCKCSLSNLFGWVVGDVGTQVGCGSCQCGYLGGVCYSRRGDLLAEGGEGVVVVVGCLVAERVGGLRWLCWRVRRFKVLTDNSGASDSEVIFSNRDLSSHGDGEGGG
jgi:hypothetical protein